MAGGQDFVVSICPKGNRACPGDALGRETIEKGNRACPGDALGHLTFVQGEPGLPGGCLRTPIL